jgi:O-antigen ligase
MQTGATPFINRTFLVTLIPWLALTVVLFLAPNLDIFPFGFIYDEKRLLEISWLFIILLVGLFNSQTLTQTGALFSQLTMTSRWLLLILLFFGLLSAIYAPLPERGMQEFSLFLAMAMAIFILAAGVQLNQSSVYFFFAVVVLFNMYFLAGLVGGLAASLYKGILVDWPYPVTGFTHIRFFNQYMVPNFPIMVGLPLLMKSRVSPMLIKVFIGSLPLWSFFLFYTGSRGAPLAIVVSGILIALLYRKKAYAYLKLLGFTLISGYLLFLAFTNIPGLMGKEVGVVPDFIQRTMNQQDVTSGRIKLMGHAWEDFQENPVLGIGPMHFTYGHTNLPGHPHNSLLQALGEWGLINTVLLAGIVIIGLRNWFVYSRRAVQGSDDQQSRIIVIMTAAFLSAAVYSIFSGVTIMPLGQAMMTAIIGLMTGLYFSNQTVATSIQDSLLIRLPTLLLIGSAIVLLFIFVLPEFVARATGQVFYLDLSVRNLGPRFWQFGSTP